jgi:hypothetical protein
METIWSVMIDIGSSPEERAMQQLRGSGISKEAAARVRNYCKDALEQVATFGKKSSAELCALKGAKRGTIADKLEKMYSDEEALQANLVANLGVVLSGEEESQFRYWALKNQSHMEVHDERGLPELAYEIRTGSVEARPITDRACGVGEIEEAEASQRSVGTDP